MCNIFSTHITLSADAVTITEGETFSYITVYPDGYEPGSSKVVYLTFDDGPTKYTPQILKILEEHDVLATFFVVGNRELAYMSDIVDKGHTIGLHSYNHDFNQIYRSVDAFLEDLAKIDEVVFNQTGIRSNIMRFPGGSSVTKGAAKAIMPKLKAEVTNKGYQFFDWNCDSRDKMGAKTACTALAKVKAAEKTAGDIVIVLMHDTEKITVQYLPWVIEHFKALGYDFLPLCPASPAIHHTW
ncbi:MAG: polysaccharide deacetylase [Defluviitaleaceae bacterium]|nr:polysaccharide deacetylase [Defluviitaleaceae bacterium]